MNSEMLPPKTFRARAVRSIWNLLPLLFLITLIALALLLTGRVMHAKAVLQAEKAAAEKPRRPAINVVLQQVAPALVRDRINLPGIMEPWVRLQLLAEIHGAIIEVPLSEGARVSAGDVILRIEPRDFQIAQDAAQASYQLAAADLKRSRELSAKKLISPAALENAEALEAAQKSVLENSRLQLQRCTVVAPISGVVNRLDAKKGLLLSVGDPIGEILQLDRLKAMVGIPESDVDAVRGLAKIDLEIQALDNLKVVGSKIFLARAPETLARLYRLDLEIDNRNGAMLPGMFFRAEIVKRQVPDGISVPLYSVISRGREQFVYLEQEGKAVKRMVETGILEGWLIQITKGLVPGDKVIVVGHRNLEEGYPVQVLKTVADPAELAP